MFKFKEIKQRYATRELRNRSFLTTRFSNFKRLKKASKQREGIIKKTQTVIYHPIGIVHSESNS